MLECISRKFKEKLYYPLCVYTNNPSLLLCIVLSDCSQVSISCSYWLINRTGLPLVFKQEGASFEAAGQLEEHEKASTTTPLLFSYSEGELVEK